VVQLSRDAATLHSSTTSLLPPLVSSQFAIPMAAAPSTIAAATAAEDEARLLRLEEQAEHGGGGAWEYLCLSLKLRARRPAHVLRIGLGLLNNSSARSRLAAERNALRPPLVSR
jgi:hypothetical protein